MPVARALEGASVSVRPSPHTTTFRNTYHGFARQQVISEHASMIGLSDVPPEWRSAPVVLLGPVAGELRQDLFQSFQNSLLGVTPQGMMRAWAGEGLVHAIRWTEAEQLLTGVDVLVVSEEDLPDQRELARYVQLVEIVALTHSERGATVYERGVARKFPAYPCSPTDPTGAGDVFAAAFLLELHGSGSIELAARFANSAASHVIEVEGPGAPTREQIEARIAAAESR